MQLRFTCILLSFTLLCAIPASAQFGGLGKKIKEKVVSAAKESGKDLARQKLDELQGEYDSTACNYAISLSDNAGLFENTERFDRHKKILFGMARGDEGRTAEEEAEGMNEAGEMFYANERYRLAEVYFLAALANYIDAYATSSPQYADVLANLGLLYHTTGRYELAEKFSVEAIKLRKDLLGRNSVAYAASMNNLSVLRKDQGDYNKSEKQVETTLEICRELLGTDNMPYAIALNNKAILFQTVGRAEEALPLMQEAIKIAKDVLSEKSGNYQRLMVNLALLYQDMERYGEAEEIYLEAIALKEKRFGKRHPDYAHMLSNLASLYMLMGKTGQVEELLIDALDIYVVRLSEEHPSYASAAANLGNFYRVEGRLDEAAPLLEKAYAIRKNVMGEKNPAFVRSKEDLALLAWAQGDAAKAHELYTEVLDQSLAFIEEYFLPMSEREKARYWERLKPRFQRFSSFALDQHEAIPALAGDLLGYQMATKGILLNASQRMREDILSSGDEELVAAWTEWVDQKENLARLYSYSKAELAEQQINLDSLEQAANSNEKKLSKWLTTLDPSGQGVKKYDPAAFQDWLSSGQVAVEIIHVPEYKAGFTGNTSYAALIMKEGASAPELVVLENGNHLDTRYYKYYKSAVKFKTADEFSYDQYWKPVEEVLGGAKEVFVSLDGVYHQINLNTLRKADGSFVIDHYTLHVIESSRDLAAVKEQTVDSKKQVYIVGFPNYGTTGSVTPLPGTKKEASTVQSILKGKFTGTTLLMEDQANEENIKEIRNPAILHIATHGFFLEDVSEKEEKVFGVEVEKAKDNPLLRSGLMLAGAEKAVANEQQEEAGANNGILTAYEAVNMHLGKTDFVVLSACETGLGDVVSGEGVYGLQRAFLVAGANSVIMSLWKVNDEATQQLMTTFYSKWLQSGDQTAAFREAQLSLKSKYKDPYYWGAFVMVKNSL